MSPLIYPNSSFNQTIVSYTASNNTKVQLSAVLKLNVHCTYHFTIHCIKPLDHSGVQFDGICDIRENLLKRMGRLLVEKYTHGFPRLYPAADYGHQFGSDEILVILGFYWTSLGTGQRGGRSCRCSGLDVDWPVGVDILSVFQILVRLNWSTYVTLTCDTKLNNKWNNQWVSLRTDHSIIQTCFCEPIQKFHWKDLTKKKKKVIFIYFYIFLVPQKKVICVWNKLRGIS